MKSRHIFRGAAISLILGAIVLGTTAFADKYQNVIRKLSMLEGVINEYEFCKKLNIKPDKIDSFLYESSN